MLTSPDQETEDELLPPPAWQDVEADEEFQKLSPAKKQVTLSNWTQALNKFALATGQYEDKDTGDAVKKFVKTKAAEYASQWGDSVSAGVYDDSAFGYASRLVDRANLGVQQVVPNLLANTNRLAELAVEAPGVVPAAMDAVGINKLSPDPQVREKGLTENFRQTTAPLREQFQKTADFYRQQGSEIAEAGQAVGGGVVGEAVQAMATAAPEAVQDMALAMATGGASTGEMLARPTAAAMRSLNVSSIISGVRSALPSLDAAEAQYLEQNPGMSREEARMRATPEALVSGASTALVTKLGGFTGVESVLKESGAAGLRAKTLEVLKEALSEGVEESTDQSLQDLAERWYRNPQKAWADTYKEIGMAFTLGSVLGGGFSATAQALSGAAEKAGQNNAPQTAAVLRDRAIQESAVKTAELFGDETTAEEARKLAAEILSSEGEADPVEVQPIAGDGGTTTAVEADPNADVLRDFGIEKSPAAAPRPVATVEPAVEEAAPAVEQPAGRLDIKTGLPVEPPVPAVEVIAPEQLSEIDVKVQDALDSGLLKSDEEAAAYRQNLLDALPLQAAPVAPVVETAPVTIPEEKVDEKAIIPKELFHGTQSSKEFDQLVGSDGDLGPHAGSQEQAKIFAGEKGRIIKVPVTAKNPIRLRDVGNWKKPLLIFEKNRDLVPDADELENKLREFAETSIGTKYPGEDLFRFAADTDRVKSGLAAIVRGHLSERGYDSVVYDNTAEKGGDSYIFFPKTEKPVSSEAPVTISEQEGGENNDEIKTNDQEGQRRQEVLTPAEADGAALPETEVAAPSPAASELLSRVRTRAPVIDEESEDSVFEAVADEPAFDVIEALATAGADVNEVVALREDPPEPGETFGQWAERAGGSIAAFDSRPTRYNGERKIYEPVGTSPIKRLAQAIKGTAELAPDTEVDTTAVLTKAEQEVERKAAVAPLTPTAASEEVLAENEDPEVSRTPVTFTGANRVLVSKKNPRLPVQEITYRSGATKTVLAIVPDPALVVEVLSKNGGADRLYVSPEVADKLDPTKVQMATEKGTGKRYVVAAYHPRFPGVRFGPDGKTESGQTLESLYQQDETRKKNSAAQTEGKAVSLPEESEDYTAKVDEAPASEFETKSPEKFQANLVRISELAAGLAGETYVTNDGVTATIGPTMAERIGAAAVSKYRARLRGVETGKANPAAVVADIKKKILPALKARVSETSGVSLDQEVGDGGDTLGSITQDAPAQTQAQTDSEVPQPAEQATGPVDNAPTGPKSLADTARQAQAEVLAGMLIEEQAILQEAIRRKTERDAKGRQKPLTKEQKEAFAKAESKIKARVKELLSAETPEGYDDKSGIPIASAPTPSGNQNVVNTNAEELLRLSGGVDGVYRGLPSLLQNIAADTTQSPWVRTIAKMLVKMNIDFSGVVIQPVNSLNRQWAGLYTAVVDSASQGIISLNLAQPQEGSLGQTIVHEALHHISLYKLERGFKRNAVEQAAYRDLLKILTHVRRKIVVPTNGQTLSQAASEVSSQARTFYGIKNLKELFAEAFSNPEFAAWLSGQRAIPGIETKGGLRPTLWEQLKYLIKKWVTGIDVRPDSLLAQALDSMFVLTATPATAEQVVEYNTRGVVESAESAPASTTLRDVAEQMPIDAPMKGELVDAPKDNSNPRLVERAIEAAGKAFNAIFGKTVVAVDGRKIVIQRKGEGLLETFRHITKDNKTMSYNMQKVRTVPAIERTLKEATARLVDTQDGDQVYLYVRRIGASEWHTVVVRADDGALVDHGVESFTSARLATQYSFGRSDAGKMSLPVDREAKGLALWRVNTPLGQSRDPEPSPRNQDTTGGGNVQQKMLAAPNWVVDVSNPEEIAATTRIKALVEELIISPHIPVTYATVNGSPAAATLDEAGNMGITIDPAALDFVTFGLNEQETRDVVEAYIRHETIHIAGFMGDYRIPDAQGRIGKEKLEAFHDEVLTPEMRQDVANTYVRQLPEESDEAFAARKAAFLSNKVAVVAEYKRMFAERYLNGNSQEDVLDAIEAKTGNKFGDFLRGMMDYIRAKLRWMEARWQATRDPRIKAEVLTDLRNLELLSDRSGATLDQLMYRDDLQRQAKWLNEQAAEEGNKSFDTAPFELQMQLASEWRENHPESIVEGIYRSQPVNLPERAETAGEALLRLADERGGDLFSFKSPLSDSTDLAAVLDSTGTEFSVTNAAGGLFISTRQSAQIGDPVTISTGTDTYTAGDLLNRNGSTSTIRRYDNGQTVIVLTAEVSDANKAFYLREDQPGEWVIDSSMGALDESVKAYQAIYQWAANSGVKIVPDTITSWEGNYRRNAHQLSSALRQQSANHFTPTDDQLGRMFPQAATPADAWNQSSTAERIEALLRAEASYVEQALPGIVKFDYDFGTNTIREAGKGLDRRQFGQRLRAEVSGTQTGAGLPDPKRVGIRTALRYLAAKSIIRGDAGGSAGSTSDLGPLKGVFYASPARRARMRKRNLGGWKLSGLFQQGDMDMRVFNLIQAKDAGLRGDSFRAKEIAKKFNRLVTKHNPDVTDLQEALGTTDNRLTDAQSAQYDKLKQAAKREKDATKRQAALSAAENFKAGEIRTNIAAATARSQAALAKLPKELADVVRTMRDDIKALNNTMINSGMLSGPMSVLVDENKEVYLNRAYEIFDNPEWADFILNDPSPDSVMIRNRMANLSRAQLIAQKVKEIRRAARLAGTPVPSRASAIATASTLVTPDDVQNLMLDYLRVADKTAGMTFTGQLAGKQDTRILKMRGQIPKEIRDFWGEYKDPGVNYARTFMKLSAFVADHNFQQDLLDIGLKAGFLWKEGVSTGSAPLNWVPVYGEADGKPHPTPMAGVRAPEIVAEAIQEAGKIYKADGVQKAVMALTGWVMASKTVYNIPQSNVRNFVGNFLIMTANGYVTQDWGSFKRLGVAGGTVAPQAFGLRLERKQDVVDYVERLTKLNIMGDNVKANVVKTLTDVIFDRDPGTAWSRSQQKAFNALKDVNERATEAYGAVDDFWKIFAFETELALMQKAFPAATPAEHDRMAADRVVRVVPTYSRIPAVVQNLVKKQPYFAPFISWTSEIMRVSANSLLLATEDMRSGNKALQVSGAKRMLSFLASNALLGAVASAVRDMVAGMSEDDEDDLRRFLPEWQKKALLMMLNKTADGKVSFVDLSFLNPFSILQEPFIAAKVEMGSTGNPFAAAGSAAQSLLEPWTSEQLFFGELISVLRGVDADGRKLWEPADSSAKKIETGALRLLGTATPGTVNIARRIWMAAEGTVTPSGRSYNLANELLGPVVGQRISQADTQQTFDSSKIGAFLRMQQSATSLATQSYRNRGTIDAAEIRRQYDQSNSARLASFINLHKDIEAARRLGVPEGAIMRSLARVPANDRAEILNGVYRKYVPSPETIRAGVSNPQGEERRRVLLEAIEAYPNEQVITSPTAD